MRKLLMPIGVAIAGIMIGVSGAALEDFYRSSDTDTKTVKLICGDAKGVFHFVQQEYKEIGAIVMLDTTEQRTITLLVNPENKSWTLLEMIDERACIIATGQGVFNAADIMKSKTQKSL